MTATLVGIACWGAVAATDCWSAEPRPRNQASAADTLILPPEKGDAEAGGGSGATLLRALRAMGRNRLDHVGIVTATVDADGCRNAPLQPRSLSMDDGLQALTEALRRKGVQVTVIPAQDVLAIDDADQKRIQAMKGSFNLQTVEGGGRWLATRADLMACMRADRPRGQGRVAHPALKAMLAALDQDVVVVVEESQSETKGPYWNMVEGLINSDGKSYYAGASHAAVAATLVIWDGTILWSGKASARGVLRPPLDAQALGVLEAYMGGQIAKLEAYRKAHPDADASEPPDGVLDPSFNATADGNLEEAPEGATLGPSAQATLQAAAGRLAEQLKAVLPVR